MANNKLDEGFEEVALDEGFVEQPTDEPMTAKKAAMAGLDYLGRGLDYAGGLARTGLARSPQAMLAQKLAGLNITSQDDLARAIKGQAPKTEEYLTRAGVPEGLKASDIVPSAYSQTGEEWTKLQKGGWADPSARGVAGFVGDVATDPLTYLSLGTTGAAKTAMNPAAKALEKAGEKLYKSGFKAADTRLAERGLAPVSGYALEQGMWGGRKSLLDQMAKRKGELMKLREGKFKELTQKGASVDFNKAEQQALDNIIEGTSKKYGGQSQADALLQKLAERPSGDLPSGKASLGMASEIKSDLYGQLPAAAFDVNGRLTSEGKKMLQDLSQGYRKEIVEAANRAEAGAGDYIDKLNAEFAAYANAQKPIRKDLAVSERKNLITQVKGALAAKEPAMAAAMYTAQGLNTPAFRTGAGLAAQRLGSKGAGVIDPVLRRLLLEQQSTQEPVNPWERIK